MNHHRLEIARQPGLTRLRCEPCNFYAALIDGATEAETERLMKQAVDEHLTAVKYQPLPEALVKPFTAGFSELRREGDCSVCGKAECVSTDAAHREPNSPKFRAGTGAARALGLRDARRTVAGLLERADEQPRPSKRRTQ